MGKLHRAKLVCDATCRVPDNRGLGSGYGKGKSACGFVLLDDRDTIIEQRSKYLGEMTIPQAEYSGLIFGLDAAVEFCRHNVDVWMDSELVVRQMLGDYCIRSDAVKLLYDEVKRRERRFLGQVSYFHHSRGSFWARHADELANAEYSKNQTG